MTKKDYILIADAIKRAQVSLLYASVNTGETIRSVAVVAESVGFALEKDNSRFDWLKFIESCGIMEEKS